MGLEEQGVYFGNEEWHRELERLIEFPGMFAFYYGRKYGDSGESYIRVERLSTGIRVPENVKYKDLKSAYAEESLVYLEYIKTTVEYKDIIEKVAIDWDVDFL